MPLTKFVERLAPAAVTAVQGDGADSVRMPPFGRVVSDHGQVWAERDGARVELEGRV